MSGDRPELTVHVGLPKTGTSAIQRYMYSNREKLAEQNIYWANTHPNGIHEINDWAHHIYSHKWGGWLDPSTFPVSPDEAWAQLGEEIQAKGGRHFVSSERFADLLPLPIGRDVLEFIKKIASPAIVKVIGYVRRQDNLVESHIKELVKGRNLNRSIEDYLTDLPSFVSFDKSFLNAADVLGQDNVTVRVYERDLLVRRDVVADFIQVCGIPEIADPCTIETIANPSLNTLSCKVLSDPRVQEAFQHFPYRVHFVSNLLNQKKFGRFDKFSLLPSETRSKLMEDFSEGNGILATKFLDKSLQDALKYDGSSSFESIDENELVLSYEELVSLLLEFKPPRPNS